MRVLYLSFTAQLTGSPLGGVVPCGGETITYFYARYFSMENITEYDVGFQNYFLLIFQQPL